MIQDIYLDNAATTQIDPRVLDAMLPWLSAGYGNPSSTYGKGRTARLAVETSRKRIAACLNCPPSSIVFTGGGTESANTVIRSAMKAGSVTPIITSPTEHKCVLTPVAALNPARVHYLTLNTDTRPSLEELDSVLSGSDPGTLVCLMHANNETGTLTDMEDVVTICQQYGAILFSDTVPTIGHLPLDLSKLKLDFCSASAHKFHGPKGVGFLYIREGLGVSPLLLGGGHESGRRAGTENVAAIVGMAQALEIACAKMEADRVNIQAMKNILRTRLLVLGATINGADNDHSLYTILNAGFPLTDRTENLLMHLDMAGIAVSGGSACNAGKGGSHVMEAIGASNHVNLRFSFSRFNTLNDIETVGGILTGFLQPTSTVLS